MRSRQQTRPGLRYALVTPARNERANLERLADSVRTQTLAPTCWTLVDDGSTDGTPEHAERLAEWLPNLRVVHARTRNGALHDGRREGRDLLAFQQGVRSLPESYDVVVKLDADLSFGPDYFERLIGRFAEDPRLGIASGTCHELEHGEWQRRKVVPTAVWGASRAYRGDCLDAVLDLAPHVGWDGIDEIKVQLRGYSTETLIDLPFYHHRPEGQREAARVHAHALSGRAAWYMGYRPTYLFLRSLYRARRDRAALGLLWGYLNCAVERAPRCPEPGVIEAFRSRQRLSVVLRGGAPE
jgi:glycosyltransferase involved in cell wall biosynthesis